MVINLEGFQVVTGLTAARAATETSRLAAPGGDFIAGVQGGSDPAAAASRLMAMTATTASTPIPTQLTPERRFLLGVLQHAERRISHNAEGVGKRLGMLVALRIGPLRELREGPAATHFVALDEELTQVSAQIKGQDLHAAAIYLYRAHASLRRAILDLMEIDSDSVRFAADGQGLSDGLAWIRESLRIFHQAVDAQKPVHQQLLWLFKALLERHGWVPEDFFYPLLGPTSGVGSPIAVTVTSGAELLDQLALFGSRVRVRIEAGAEIDLTAVLRQVLDLPDPKLETGLLRMPIRGRFRDVEIVDAEDHRLVWFDEAGRLAEAPSLLTYKTEVEIPPEWRQSGGPDRIRAQDVVVVGGGPGGIATALELASRGIFDTVVLEAGDRPLAAIFELYPAGKPVERDYGGQTESPEGIVGLDDSTDIAFYRRLESFVNFGHLNIQTGERMVAIRRAGDYYVVRTETGKIFAGRHLVMAAGRLHKPRMPNGFEAWEPEIREHVLPASARAVGQFGGQRVLVIGGGQTAFNMVQALLAQNAQVLLSYRGTDFNRLAPSQAEQLLAFERSGRVIILRGSNVSGMSRREGEDGDHLIVNFAEPGLGPLIIEGVIVAMGYSFDRSLLQLPGYADLRVEEGRAILSDGTRLPGLYPIGDFLKSRSVLAAMNGAVRAVREIESALS